MMVVAVLPTDYGKSFIFQMLPYFLPNKNEENENKNIVQSDQVLHVMLFDCRKIAKHPYLCQEKLGLIDITALDIRFSSLMQINYRKIM